MCSAMWSYSYPVVVLLLNVFCCIDQVYIHVRTGVASRSHVALLLQTCRWSHSWSPRVGPGHPSSPLSIYFLIFSPFYFSLCFLGFTYFLLLSIPTLSTRIVPLRFQAGGRRRRPNLNLVCFVLSVFLSLDVFWCFVVFGLVFSFVCVPSVLWHCWLGHLTLKTRPHMTYNVFGGTLSLTQSINQPIPDRNVVPRADFRVSRQSLSCPIYTEHVQMDSSCTLTE